jgi:hypothetical protein
MASFKKLSKSDVTFVPYYANKQWTISIDCFPTSNEYLTIYKGTNLTGSFSSGSDPKSEGQYERLVYSQINQLFYQKYITSLNTSSLVNSIYYESASQQRPTSSYFIYNDSARLIENFPTGAMEGIRVLAINQDIFGDKILPNTFMLSSSAYYVVDDGYGNLYDTNTHIGNLFYAHGLGVITNQDYQLMFPLADCNTTTTTTSTTTSTTTAEPTTTTTSTTTSTTTAEPTTTTTSTTTSTTTAEPTTTTTSTTTSTTTAEPTTTTTSTTTSTTTAEPTTTTTSTTTSTTTAEPTTTTSTTTSTTTCPPLAYSYTLYYNSGSIESSITGSSSTNGACNLLVSSSTVYSPSSSFTVGTPLYYDECGTIPITASAYTSANSYFRYSDSKYVTFETDGYTVRSTPFCSSQLNLSYQNNVTDSTPQTWEVEYSTSSLFTTSVGIIVTDDLAGGPAEAGVFSPGPLNITGSTPVPIYVRVRKNSNSGNMYGNTSFGLFIDNGVDGYTSVGGFTFTIADNPIGTFEDITTNLSSPSIPNGYRVLLQIQESGTA